MDANVIYIDGEEYEVVDTLEYITMADSFVKNKIGRGHGEAKLYVGNENDNLAQFFDDYKEAECIFRKSDFEAYLKDAKEEFEDPQQEYAKKEKMPEIYGKLQVAVDQLPYEILRFEMYRVGVQPPRVYLNSRSDYYNFMRSLGLPNISYISVLKLKNSMNRLLYYYKMFIDYKSDLINYEMKSVREQEERIAEDKKLSSKFKETLIKSRVGQGDYRRKLLEECNCCPFTKVTDERLLVASHIKPWAASNDEEKIDPKNGFVFTPTYDWLFDRGFISFDDNKILMVSPWISPMNQKRLGIINGKRVNDLPLDENRKKYLRYHREKVFKS